MNIRLTQKNLNKGISKNNGFNAEQIRCLGESIFKKGWKKRLLNKLVEESDYNQFLHLKNNHLDNINYTNQHYLTKVDKVKKKSKYSIIIENEKLTSDIQLRRYIVDKVKYGKEIKIVLFIQQLKKRNDELEEEIRQLKSISENCAIDENFQDDAEESYNNFLYATNGI